MSNLSDAVKEAVRDMIDNEEIKVVVEDGEIRLSVVDQDLEDEDSDE
jgi:hypothetical protein